MSGTTAIDPKDPYRAAHLLIQQYGREAKEHAMQHALDSRTAGDGQGEEIWLGVFEAVLELQSTHRPGGQVIH